MAVGCYCAILSLLQWLELEHIREYFMWLQEIECIMLQEAVTVLL